MSKLQQKDIPCSECGEPSHAKGLCKFHYSKSIFIVGNSKTDALTLRMKRVLKGIEYRCNNPESRSYKQYGGRGIKNNLTIEDLRFLWVRDSAHLLTRPSVDRKDANKGYTLDNCRFIELVENCRLQRAKTVCRRCNQVKRYCDKYQQCAECRVFAYCTHCGKPFERNGCVKICGDCRIMQRPCAYCGKIIKRDVVIERSFIENKQWFCSRVEHGKWLGENYGKFHGNKAA